MNEQIEMFTTSEIKALTAKAAVWGFCYGLVCAVAVAALFLFFTGEIIWFD